MDSSYRGAWGDMKLGLNIQLRLAMGFALLGACDTGSGNAGEVTASCSDEVRADDYEQGCSVDADCVAVYEGPVSDACRCVNAAISADELATYESDLGPESCYDPSNCLADCIAVPGAQGACVEETCVVGTPFSCGGESCNGETQFCFSLGSDIAGEPGGSSCVPLPTECTNSNDCSCFLGSDVPFNAEFCLEQGSCSHDGRRFAFGCPGG